MKKGDDVAGDDDDDAVRTVNYKTEWHRKCVLRNNSSALSIYSTLHTSDRLNVGGGGMDGQHDTFSGVSWVSHLPAGPPYGLQGFW
jgi:hypothetical protein